MSRTPTISSFFGYTLGARLNNIRWSWGAVHPKSGDVFLRVWEDEIKIIDGRECVLVLGPGWARAGLNERKRHIQDILNGSRGYSVICTAKKTPSTSREIESYNSTHLGVLGKVLDHEGLKYAEIRGYIPIENLQDSIPGSNRTEWTIEELEACVVAYLEMLNAEQSGILYSKSEFNKRLRQGSLSSRSKPSIEYRMRNISAVLEELGLSRIQGYLPATNIGANSHQVIARLLESHGHFNQVDFELTDDDEVLQQRTSSLRKTRLGLHPSGNPNPESKVRNCVVYMRSPAVQARVLEIANGVCEHCEEAAPFVDENNRPFLEVHHVVPLSEGGADVVQNAVALCPNCHRRCHHARDRSVATELLYQHVERLIR